MMAHHSAIDVAKWFLNRNNVEAMISEAEDISNLKLQKLLYYAQGAVLAITGDPLFDDCIVAWEHGPVVIDVYHKYKGNGRNGIPFNDDEPSEEYTEEEQSILESVYEEFGQYSAWKLRNMTHKETPWLSTKKNDVIRLDVIEKYFKEHYVAA